MIDLKKPRLIPRGADYCDGCVWYENGLCAHRKDLNSCKDGIAAHDALRDFYDAIESGDLVPVVHGRWKQHYITTSDNETLPYGWNCSSCGRFKMEQQPTCKCGAKMDLEEEK